MKKDFKTRVADAGEDIKDTFTIKKEEPAKVTKDSEPSLQERVREHSVCGTCLQTFDDQPRKSKVEGKFNGEKVVAFQCPACEAKDKPVQLVVQEVDGNEQGFVEVSVRSLDKPLKD